MDERTQWSQLPMGNMRPCVDPPVLPLIAAGEASTDVAGSWRVRVGTGAYAKQGNTKWQMVDRGRGHIEDLHRRIMYRKGCYTSGRGTSGHAFGFTQAAATITVATTGFAHAESHFHHLEVHIAGLNDRQAHTCRHKDGKK